MRSTEVADRNMEPETCDEEEYFTCLQCGEPEPIEVKVVFEGQPFCSHECATEYAIEGATNEELAEYASKNTFGIWLQHAFITKKDLLNMRPLMERYVAEEQYYFYEWLEDYREEQVAKPKKPGEVA